MITANRDEFSRFVQVPDDQFVTDKGRELKSMIAEVRSQLNLDKVIGCSPKRFFLGEQLWTLFSQQVIRESFLFDLEFFFLSILFFSFSRLIYPCFFFFVDCAIHVVFRSNDGSHDAQNWSPI